MKDSYDVVVVGAGIVGTAIAYNLSQAGIRDVLVLENQVLYKEEQPASGVSDVDPYKGEYRVVGKH